MAESLGFGAGDSDLNAYVMGNPVSLADPGGAFVLAPWPLANAVGGGSAALTDGILNSLFRA